MPAREGYKTLDLVAIELGVSEDKVRTIIGVLNIQSRTFPEDRRRRYYSSEDVDRIKKLLSNA